MENLNTHFATDGEHLFQLKMPACPAARREHPGCGFVRKQTTENKTTVLHTPEGRLTCITDHRGNILRPFLKKAGDAEKLNEFLKCVELYPPEKSPMHNAGPSPMRQLTALWAQDYEAFSAQDPALYASSERRLTRLFAQKAALCAENCGCLLIIDDMLTSSDLPLSGRLAEGYDKLLERTNLPMLVTIHEDCAGQLPVLNAAFAKRLKQCNLLQEDGSLKIHDQLLAVSVPCPAEE